MLLPFTGGENKTDKPELFSLVKIRTSKTKEVHIQQRCNSVIEITHPVPTHIREADLFEIH